MTKNHPDPKMAFDGYRPLTEGYQPGSQVSLHGFNAKPPTSAPPPPPPSGGSSVMKPMAMRPPEKK